jgi:hypothetical protein
MKNLYLGITMILIASHQSYYGLTGLEIFKPYPIGKVAMIGLLLLKVAFFFALTHFLIRYSKIELLVNRELPISKIIIVASLAILIVSSPFNTPFNFVGKFSALIRDTAQISIFFTLMHMFVQKKFAEKAALQ